MKRMDFFAGQGARRRHSRDYGNDKQRGIDMDGLSTSFLNDLTAAGYSPESIDVVVCTRTSRAYTTAPPG